MSEAVRVFVNGKGLDAPAGGTALDAVAVHSADAAAEVSAGSLIITDSRGLPIGADTNLVNGSLFRLIPNRTRDTADPAARFDT